MKLWNIEIFLLDEAGNEKQAKCFTKAVYTLHPSFANPIQSMDSFTSSKTLGHVRKEG
jgi:transcription initiation factor IIF auxiliary subunit